MELWYNLDGNLILLISLNHMCEVKLLLWKNYKNNNYCIFISQMMAGIYVLNYGICSTCFPTVLPQKVAKLIIFVT